MIETERLVLRPFVESDAEDVVEYLHQPAVHCFYSMKLDSLEAAKAEMKKRAKDAFYLAIVLKDSGKVIGEIFGNPEGTGPEDETLDTFSPCWMLNLDYGGAILIPNESIGTEKPEQLPDKDQIILIYCRSGNRSKQAAQKLADMGYTNIYEFGGINTWTGEVVTE